MNGLAKWLEERGKRGNIARLVVTRGVDFEETVDTIVPNPGEDDETLANRVTDCAREDARGFQESETYFVHLYRDGAQKPETRRPVDFEAPRGEEDEDDGRHDEHKGFSIMARFATDSGRILTQLAKLGIDKSDMEKSRLYLRNQALEDRDFARADLMTKLMQNEEERKERAEERKDKALFTRKLWEQFELLLPIGLSYLMGKGPTIGPALEEKLLHKFLGSIRPEQREPLMAQLDTVQRLVVMELMMRGDEMPMELKSSEIQRLLNSITEEQITGIGGILDTDEQVKAWFELHHVRKLGIAARTRQLKGGGEGGGNG